MKIFQLTLKCFHLEEMKKFYTEVLEMSLMNESDGHFTVMAGTTKLIFERDSSNPFYHICFRTNQNYYDYIYHRLSSENCLLPDEEGNISMFWEGKQAYFTDPDGNILEVLERPFHWGNENTSGWFDVGEIGLPVQSICDIQQYLDSSFENKFKAESEKFSFYGNQEGVFVMVKEGRHWYPTKRPATIHPIKAVISGDQEKRFSHPEYPYEWIVKKEWKESVPAVQFRVARPTNQIDKIIEFYQQGLGLRKIGEFHGHEGYDGVMFGAPEFSYHLEFTQSEEYIELPKPTKEHLLVFYIPNIFELKKIVLRLADMGFHEVEPENPYWGRGGVTIEDPDGWRVVLMNSTGI